MRSRVANAATRSRSPRSSPVRSASARSRWPTTSPRVTRASIEAGPKSIWRYRQLLPVPSDVTRHPNTEPGLTRLIKADRLAAALGVRSLWVKDDTGNPTHSFKDRVVAVALAAARELGFTVLACPSTGNLANAVAAAAARQGWDSVVLIGYRFVFRVLRLRGENRACERERQQNHENPERFPRDALVNTGLRPGETTRRRMEPF